jgi:glycosyltransferase involved in cell wall biosynthesis
VISVITCTGRGNAALEIMAACLERQTVRDFEWIIVDRIVTQRPKDFYKDLQAHTSFPIVPIEPKWSIYHEHNMPAIANARNSGLIMARGDFVVWIDDNMWFKPDYLARHLYAHSFANGRPYYLVGITWPFTDWNTIETLAQKEPYDVAGNFCRTCNWEENKAAGRLHDDHRMFMRYTRPDGGKPVSEGPYELIKGSWCFSGNLSVPLQLALDVNGFDEECDGAPEGEDVDFGLRLDNLGCMGLFDRKCYVYKYRNPSLPSLRELYPYTRGYIGEVNGVKIQRCEFRMWAIMREKWRVRANATFDLRQIRDRVE